jgi:glycosyltransferase involved in cell wall biosynthesis
MRVAIYVANISVVPGYEMNVSGHVQIPLHAATLLVEAGHEVEIITTRWSSGRVLPSVVPETPIHQLTDPRERLVQTAPRTRHLAALAHARELRTLANDRDFDVLHAFGAPTTAAALGALRRLRGLRVPVVYSLLHPIPPSVAILAACRGVDIFTASSEAVARTASGAGLVCPIVRHGPIRSHSVTTARQRMRVLFWREASHDNGGDLCLTAFDELAQRFPDLVFTLALRPFADEVPGVDAVATRHVNVEVHRFPYESGPDLSTLIGESIVVCLPFRRQTIYPQLSVLESLDAGVPVVCLDTGDMAEVVQDGNNGLVVDSPTARGVTEGLAGLLTQTELLDRMHRRLASGPASWTWTSYVPEISELYDRVSRRVENRSEQ